VVTRYDRPIVVLSAVGSPALHPSTAAGDLEPFAPLLHDEAILSALKQDRGDR
jgi:hypothetical protein